MVDAMPIAAAPARSGARRLWDTDPFLLLDWESPEWTGAAPVAREWAGGEPLGSRPPAHAREHQLPAFDWGQVERETWDTAERAVLDAAPGAGSWTPSTARPEHDAEQAWAATPEWLLPDWLVASDPAPRTQQPVSASDPAEGNVPFPRRRDLRAARAAEAAGVAAPQPPVVDPGAGDLPGYPDPQRSRARETSLPRRRDLRATGSVPRVVPEPTRVVPDRPRRRLTSLALGSVAARVAVLTVLGTVGMATVTGTYPDSLSLRPGGLSENSSAEMALRTGAGGSESRAMVEPAALTAAQADFTARAGEIKAQISVEERTAAALTLGNRLAEKREEARERAAAKAAAKARAEAMARAIRDAQRNPRAVGRLMAADRGWTGTQWTCLNNLWTRESNWNYRADNPSSSAYGIPQALPGSKMASAGSDWQTNPVTQIEWGLDYIADRYGTPCGAWSHSESTGWY
jgi:hypothetical protein